MKSKEFYNILGEILKNNPNLNDVSIEVKTSDPAIGPVSAVKCAGVYPGFDWDDGRILIHSNERIWKENEMIKKLKEEKTYKIVSCTDLEGKEKKGYRHRIGRVVSDSVISNINGQCNVLMQYLYDCDGDSMRYGKVFKIIQVKEINRVFKNGKETIIIKTENTIYRLDEVSDKN